MPGESNCRRDVPLVEFMYLVFTRMPVESNCRKDVPLVEFMYLVFTCMPGESYHRSSLCRTCVTYSKH